MKIIWLTDLHFVSRGESLFGRDPEKQLQCAIDLINRYHTDAAYCVLSGDLVNDGDAAVYKQLGQVLNELQIPYLPMAGNHDNRDLLVQLLKLPRPLETEFVQYTVQAEGWRILLLDTVRSGHSEGEMCAARLRWLKSELDRDQVSPTLVFTHHPLLPLQLPMQDQESQHSGEQLISLLQAAGNINHWCFGHVHRPVSGAFGGICFTAMQSMAIQAPLPYPAWDWESFEPANESPGFGIIHLQKQSVVIHFQQLGLD